MSSGIADQIKLKEGESTTITLKGLATAGYVWNYTLYNNTDCIKISKEFEKPEKKIQKKMGAGVDEVFTITAKKKGIVPVHFTQQRSWEKNIDPIHEKKVTIIVE